jgi:segregation and condensation protein A
MSTASAPLATQLDDYQLRLPTFEGPLDLLLRLIERAELPIAEVSLVAVTNQFLAHVDSLGGIAPERLAEFAAIGARLVLLKSRSLLPRPPAQDDGIVDELVTMLVEYQSIRDAARDFGKVDAAGARSYPIAPGASDAPEAVELPPLARHSPLTLARALRRRLSIAPQQATAIETRQRFPIRLMLERALSIVVPGKRARMTELLATTRDRHEAITAFLAVLILVRRRVLEAEQHEPFADIELWRTAGEMLSITELAPVEETAS